MVLKELILNSFYNGSAVVFLKENRFLDVFYFGSDVVVLKELIFHSFYY